MRTINFKIKITRKSSALRLNLKDVVPDGEYQVLVVLEAMKQSLKKPLQFLTTDAAINKKQTFSRDEIYGDDGCR